MAYNAEKHRNECDRCGKPIPSNQVVQLCKECDEWLDEYYKEHYSDNKTFLYNDIQCML